MSFGGFGGFGQNTQQSSGFGAGSGFGGTTSGGAQDYAGASDVDPRRSLTTTGSRHHPADDSRRRATQ
ncbi:hypothetical protein CNMCM5878_007787 [Aspergillus fumigatiaffinis]|nr:hypothetical protein CNMCM5878_007787 [Aspergillus fumigatiaffinis]KAF4217151.1 hypothetical protein CNMCM6457_004622 [Aspergillus fumigatiaffinis]